MTDQATLHPTYTLHRGRLPLLVSVPHAGQRLTDHVAARVVDRADQVEDTDWHLDRVYAFVVELGASLITPVYSRFVIDLNRPPDNAPMYPGANNTELCPTRFFTGDPIYKAGMAPDAAEVERRRQSHWAPYHDAISAEMQRLHREHGHAMLFDGHSIKAELPWLFEGRLPDLNLGTASGTSCAPGIREALSEVLSKQSEFSHVVDGRFKGGYITRHYGQPASGWHAVQLEMGWHTYADDRAMPPTLDPARVARLEVVLRRLMTAMLAWRP